VKCIRCGYDNLPGEDLCVKCHADLRDLDIASPEEGMQRHFLEDTLETLCTHPPTTVTPDTMLREVLNLMRTKHVASVVVGTQEPFDGIFTERDFLYKVAGKDVDVDKVTVGELMTPRPATVPSDQPVAAALHAMAAISVRHVPVVRNGKLAEILSSKDILEYLQTLMAKMQTMQGHDRGEH
jgi:CBS domain-containing protein